MEGLPPVTYFTLIQPIEKSSGTEQNLHLNCGDCTSRHLERSGAESRDLEAPTILKGKYMAKSTRREKIKLVSTANTGYFYTTQKLKGKEKLVLKKYDPKVRKHVEFKESKLVK